MMKSITIATLLFVFSSFALGDVNISIQKEQEKDSQFFPNDSDETIMVYLYYANPQMINRTLWIGVSNGYTQSGINRVLFHVKGKGVYKTEQISSLRNWGTSPAYWFGVTASKEYTAEKYKLHNFRPGIRNLYELPEEPNIPVEIEIAVVTNAGNVVYCPRVFQITKLPGDSLHPFYYDTKVIARKK